MRIGDWSADVCSSDLPVQRLADTIAGVFVPVVIALAAATLGFWPTAAATAAPAVAFTAAVAVLIDRKSDMLGKGVTGRVDVEGSRIMRNKKSKVTGGHVHMSEM